MYERDSIYNFHLDLYSFHFGQEKEDEKEKE